MRVLLLGGSGFIGSAIGQALLARGCQVRALGRDMAFGRRALPSAEWVRGDLRTLTRPETWAAYLADVDVVVNASGALQTGLRDDLVAVQERAIVALVTAAGQARVARLVQISAAGAAVQETQFMQTKARADARVAASGMAHAILRPGLVIGRNAFGGNELLRMAAGAPGPAIDFAGTGRIQCVALADVVDAALRAIEGMEGSFDLVEAEGRPLGEVIALHRQWLGFPPSRSVVRVPLALLKPATWLADALGWAGWRSPLRSNAMAALVHGVEGDAAQARQALGREPLALPDALAALGHAGKADRWHARLGMLYPLALAALAALWLAGGIVGLARQDEATALLTAGGIGAGAARATVLAGSIADLAIAAGIVFRPTLKLALGVGAALATGYALAAAVVRPDLWLDPLGAMVKIVPIVVLSLMCLAMADER